MWIAAILFVVIVGVMLYFDSLKPFNYPPGPPWLPIFGSALTVRSARSEKRYLYKAVHSLNLKYCNQGVIGLRVGKDRIVIACDYNAAKEMNLNEDIDGRPKGLFYETRTWGKRRGVILNDEEVWKEQRRFIVRHLKEFGYGRRGMVELVQAEAEQLLNDMRLKVNENNNNAAVIQMHDAFSVYVLNTLWSMMAGIRYSCEDAEVKKLQNLLTELFSNIDMVGALFSQFPILRFVAPELSGYKQFIEMHQKIWIFLRAELNKHKDTFKAENEDRDFMDVYIRMIRSSERKGSFTESQLLAVCMDMFMAGSETTSKSLGFAFLYLVREPEVQRKAQYEIDTVIGKERLPTLNDRANMPYNEAIVLEAIRHFMGRTFGIPHRAIKNTSLCGYTVPKDAMVITNYYGILMDKKLFKDPQAFDPERFLVDGKISIPEPYIPFGLGKRRCMGESLARSNIFLFVVTMLQNFEIKPTPGEKPPCVHVIDGATASVAPFCALITSRHK